MDPFFQLIMNLEARAGAPFDVLTQALHAKTAPMVHIDRDNLVPVDPSRTLTDNRNISLTLAVV